MNIKNNKIAEYLVKNYLVYSNNSNRWLFRSKTKSSIREKLQIFAKDFTLKELSNSSAILKEMYFDKFHNTFITVDIYNSKGNISSKIQEETGYQTYHESSKLSCGIGTNVVLIPKELYTLEIKKELLDKYNNV
jgi:hypothetical protein